MPTIVNTRRKVRRNEPCPFCTSGKKFKKCHGALIKSDEMVPTRAAGHSHERPTLLAYTPAVKKGPRPAVAVVKKHG